MTRPESPAAIPGRLKVDADGRISGPANITYNEPFPCVNGNFGSGKIQGVVMHTMVGNLQGTIQVFNDPSYQASAHFGIAQDGRIHQFGPIGKSWVAWAQVAGNLTWYSIEHADNGNPNNPLTQPQIRASAQLVEVLSRFAGFPLQVTNTIHGQGYGVHYMGGEAWGGHTCPDLPPRHIRSLQRAPIVLIAKSIRTGKPWPAPWEANALTDAKKIQSGAASLVGLLQAGPSAALIQAQALQSEATSLVTLLKANQLPD